MKKNKLLKKLVEKLVQASFSAGKLSENKAQKIIKDLEKLPTSEAIFALTEYSKGIKRELDKTTLVIEAAVDLSKSELAKIERQVKKDFPVNQTKVVVNPNLIAGLRIRVGDLLIDNSLQDKILQIGGIIHG
ncbi:F0F1 ATP synthase subunit delta [Candidatus Daviesbacteria bacterium]|nr:F0F1 ATP synthase subunit delta [Candidatus Daviesbacteria bacterium]